MSRRPWRFRSGLIACLVWSFLVLVLFSGLRATHVLLDLGNHLHTAILFAASNVLIFWLFARPRIYPEQIVDAEIFPDYEFLTPFRQDEP